MKTYKIGDWVKVSAIVITDWEGVNRTVASNEVGPFVAQVVGATVVMEGSLVSEDGEDHAFYGPVVETSFCATKAVKVYLVRKGFMNKEIRVLECNMSLCEEPSRGLPNKHSSNLSDENREFMSQVAKEMERHPDGKFKKWCDDEN